MEKECLFSEKKVNIGPDSGYDNYIMAIESSCDETACAIVKNGRDVIANIVASQIKTHEKFGGVIPEIAAREHLEAINVVIEEAFEQSNLKPENISAFAATVGPGLVGCLLVGLNAAKTLALVHDKPFIGVNHLNAHICANYIDTDLKPPFLALLVSGGHTQIIDVESYSNQTILGETIDDAVGEAYDKVARLIGLPYPGGPLLDKLAQEGNKNAYELPVSKVGEYDFSFSGLKTSFLYTLRDEIAKNPDFISQNINDLCASLQYTIISILIEKLSKAVKQTGINRITIGGGVAANSELRDTLQQTADKKGWQVFIPERKYTTDNAAMIAITGAFKYADKDFCPMEAPAYSRGSL